MLSLNSEATYKVKVADSVHAYDLWCTCKGWRFKKGAKDCKHCEAVRQVDKGQNVPTKKTITSNSKAQKLKKVWANYQRGTRFPPEIQEVADWWNDLDETIRDQIQHELGYDPDYNITKGFSNIKPDECQQEISEDYCDPENSKSETLKKNISLPRKRKLKTTKPTKRISNKNVKVKCWHCGNPNQKILSFDTTFKCDQCNEQLWTGEGGYEEIKVGVWR